MTILICLILGVLAICLCLVIIAPKNFDINRSIVINKPLPEVFQYLKYMKNQDNWSPWKKKDPNMHQEFIGTDGEIGFTAKWQGNKDVGEGEQEIINIEEHKIIESNLRFFKPWKSESKAYLKVEALTPNKTKVYWGFSGVNKIPTNVFFLFFNMDETVGKDFAEGLASLKQILER